MNHKRSASSAFYFWLLFVFFFAKLNAQTVPGTLSGNTTVCAGSNSGLMTLSGYTGFIIRWEYSLTGFHPWAVIANTSGTLAFANLTESTYYRAIVQAAGFPEVSSNAVSAKVNPNSQVGHVDALSPQCLGNTLSVTLDDYTGRITGWQYSTSSGTFWNTIPLTADSSEIHFSNISEDTWFRATIKSGVCPVVYSDTAKVLFAAASIGGNISGIGAICAAMNTGTLTLSGNNGDIVRWESSLSGQAPWNTINQTSSSLHFSNLSQTTFFRALVQSGNCMEASSSSFEVNVSPPSVGGVITGPSAVCEGNNKGTLYLMGYTGAIQQWEYSDDWGGQWNIDPNTTALQAFSGLMQTRLYKALIQSGSCASAYSTTYTVSVNALPDVSFAMNNVCAESVLTYTNTTTGNNLYVWEFGDGGSSSTKNPEHSYMSDGVFSVKLSASSSEGCTDSLRQDIVIHPLPHPSFTALPGVCKGGAITFNNTSGISSGSINNWLWDFNDGSGSALVNPDHVFINAGTYAVKLTAISNNSCSDSVSQNIDVHPLPFADFTTSNVCKGNEAVFSNLSYIENGYSVYTWSFGDGQSSGMPSPTHLYGSASSYNVMLVANSNHNCKDTAIKAIAVNETPSVSIVASNVCFGDTVHFSQNSTPLLSNSLFDWSMGDGNSYEGVSPAHAYQSPGNYLVTLVLSTDSGCGAQAFRNISVHPLPYADFLFDNTCTSDSVYFSNASSISSGTLFYHWYFGNDSESIAGSPFKQYTAAGNYNVKLITTSNYACKDSSVRTISIFDAPVADFTSANVCDGKPLQFTDNSTVTNGSIVAYSWNFGDNSNSSVAAPVKQYLNYGTYSVSLAVVSGNGCIDTVEKAIHVFEAPLADFSATNQCINDPVAFINNTSITGGIYNSGWKFGDGAVSEIPSPIYSYTLAGSYEAWLKVTTPQGCADSVLRYIEIYDIPAVSAGSDTSIEKGFGLQMNAKGGIEYAWYPVDGLDNPLSGTPFVNPDVATTYIVEGKNANGCKSSDTIRVSVNYNTIIMAYNIITPNGNGKNDTWAIKNIETYPDNHLLIMDEWGSRVYEKKSYRNEWNGRNNTGELLPDGTYYYVLSFGNNSKTYTGYITLMRNQ